MSQIEECQKLFTGLIQIYDEIGLRDLIDRPGIEFERLLVDLMGLRGLV